MLAMLKVLWKIGAESAEKYGEYPFYGFIFFLAMGNGGAEAFSIVLILSFALRKSVRPDFQFTKDRAHFFLALFFVFSAISMLHSGPLLAKSLKALFLKWGKFCLIFLITEDYFRNERSLRRAVMAILIAATILASDAVIQVLFGADLVYRYPPMPVSHYDVLVFRAATATFDHANNLGAFLLPVSLLSFAFLLGPKPGRKGWLYAGISGLLGITLVLTFSRGAWIGFVGGFLLLLILSRRYKTGTVFLLVSIALCLFVPEIRERIFYTFTPGGDSLRGSIWGASWDLICAHPWVGQGIGTFMDRCPQVLPAGKTYAHNCYLQMWAETGVFSLAAFLLFLGTLLTRGVRAYLKCHDPMLLGILCGVFGFLVHSFFDTQFYSLRLAYQLWFFLGLLAALIRVSNKPDLKKTTCLS